MKYRPYLLLFISLCIGFTLHAQDGSTSGRKVNRSTKKPARISNYKLEQFDGRWQEIIRSNSKTKKTVPVEDTIYIRFYNNGMATTKEGNSLVASGTAEIYKHNNITTSARDFKIVSVTPDELVLDDEEGFIYTFARKDTFSYEIGKIPPQVFIDTTRPVININPLNISKSWFVYRTGAAPGFVKPQTPMIRNLIIRQKDDNEIYSGDLEYALKGKITSQACTFRVSGNNKLSISTNDYNWNMIIYKADGLEMVFGKADELMYYLKSW
jgi:hypothetical protein